MTKLEKGKEYLIGLIADRIRSADLEEFYQIMVKVVDLDLWSNQNTEDPLYPYYLHCNRCEKIYGSCTEEKQALHIGQPYYNVDESEICTKRYLKFYTEE